MRFHLRTKWLWARFPLQSLKSQISPNFWAIIFLIVTLISYCINVEVSKWNTFWVAYLIRWKCLSHRDILLFNFICTLLPVTDIKQFFKIFRRLTTSTTLRWNVFTVRLDLLILLLLLNSKFSSSQKFSEWNFSKQISLIPVLNVMTRKQVFRVFGCFMH